MKDTTDWLKNCVVSKLSVTCLFSSTGFANCIYELYTLQQHTDIVSVLFSCWFSSISLYSLNMNKDHYTISLGSCISLLLYVDEHFVLLNNEEYSMEAFKKCFCLSGNKQQISNTWVAQFARE